MTFIERRRIGILAAFTAGGLALGTSPVWAPYAGRHVDWLLVERVEITGTRMLDPHEVLAASGVATGQHLLDDATAWETALRAHPVIADVQIRRRPPGTVKIEVTEKRPVALVSDGTLRLATSEAEILPVDPFDAPMDLPVLRVTMEDSAGQARARAALAEIDRLNALAPELMRAVSEVSVSEDGPYVLTLAHNTSRIQLPVGASSERLEELRRILIDVDRRFPARAAAADRQRHRIDLRFEDQVVVRPSSSAERS